MARIAFCFNTTRYLAICRTPIIEAQVGRGYKVVAAAGIKKVC